MIEAAPQREPHISAKSAVETANLYGDFTIGLMNEMRSHPELARWVDTLRATARRGSNAAVLSEMRTVLDEGFVGHMNVVVYTAEAVREWQKRRVVYRLHHELSSQLMDTDPTNEIPCEVFRRLPHPNPFVIFPEPIPTEPALNGPPLIRKPSYLGMMVTGMTKYNWVCSTDDPELNVLVIALASSLQYVGQMVTYEERQVILPISGNRSVEQMVTDQFSGGMRSRVGADSAATDLEAMRMAVSLMLYLCSDRPDLSGSTQVVRRKRGPIHQVLDLGYDIGPKLLAARKASKSSGSSPATGKHVRTHLRRAHWHTYWTGPRDGDQTPIVKWLSSITVNEEGESGRPQVFTVD